MPRLANILPAEITAKHHALYDRALGNWSYLSHFLSNGPTREEVGILLKMELDGERRDFMITRLTGKLNTMYREELKKDVDKYLGNV